MGEMTLKIPTCDVPFFRFVLLEGIFHIKNTVYSTLKIDDVVNLSYLEQIAHGIDIVSCPFIEKKTSLNRPISDERVELLKRDVREQERRDRLKFLKKIKKLVKNSLHQAEEETFNA